MTDAADSVGHRLRRSSSVQQLVARDLSVPRCPGETGRRKCKFPDFTSVV